MSILENSLVSIIVPVYNVEKYLDHCVVSLVNQTYKNIEILLLNDGSTDQSGDLCTEWAKRDARVRYITKANEGVGETRNKGISLARGEYIAFVDPDDWVDVHFIEELYRAVSLNSADMALCDHYKMAVDSGIKSYSVNTNFMHKEFDVFESMVFGTACLWNKLTKVSLWRENKILVPKQNGEDLAVSALLMALSNKVCNVPKALYYYRKFRPGSYTDDIDKYKIIFSSIKWLLRGFKERNLYEQYKKVLYQHVLRWLSRALSPCLTRMDTTDYKLLEKEYYGFLKEAFPELPQIRVIVFGGYNLTRIANKSCFLENPYNRFQFSSIISVMDVCKLAMPEPHHRNPYRQYMLSREFHREYLRILDAKRPEYIIIDFIEERHDLVYIDGAYYTRSDALQESSFAERGRVIARNSKACQQLWQEFCIKFILELKKRFKTDHVILIKNYLSEKHGDIYRQREFADIQDIKKMNGILDSYYQFFAKHYNGIQVIDLSQDELYFTDDQYEYGCYPWHLNEIINIRMAKKMKIDSYR